MIFASIFCSLYCNCRRVQYIFIFFLVVMVFKVKYDILTYSMKLRLFKFVATRTNLFHSYSLLFLAVPAPTIVSKTGNLQDLTILKIPK